MQSKNNRTKKSEYFIFSTTINNYQAPAQSPRPKKTCSSRNVGNFTARPAHKVLEAAECKRSLLVSPTKPHLNSLDLTSPPSLSRGKSEISIALGKNSGASRNEAQRMRVGLDTTRVPCSRLARVNTIKEIVVNPMGTVLRRLPSLPRMPSSQPQSPGRASVTTRNHPRLTASKTTMTSSASRCCISSPNTKRQLGQNTLSTSSSKVKVVARIRPLNRVEEELIDNGAGEADVRAADSATLLLDSGKVSFILDTVSEGNSQTEFYDKSAKETVCDVLKGYNGTIFAYGPTGTGKTYTMLGPLPCEPERMGLIPRTSTQLFDFVRSNDVETEYEIRCGMLEIYKENLRDLLLPEDSPVAELKIKESPAKGIYVEGLAERCVVNQDEFMDLVLKGGERRVVAETRSNLSSSRSHTIFMLQVTQKYSNGTERKGKLNLVDLAGSEKLSFSTADEERVEETKKINKSLSALGNVIHALTSGNEHVPYRDSKLTRILQESLGGNYKTTLIITLSPFSGSREETTNSLKFAQRARHVRNRVHANIKQPLEECGLIICQLRAELRDAKAQLEQMQGFISKNMPGAPLQLNAGEEQASEEPGSKRLSGDDSEPGAAHKASAGSQCRENSADLVAEKEMWELKAGQYKRETETQKGIADEYAENLEKCREKLSQERKFRLAAEQSVKEYETLQAITEIKKYKQELQEDHIQLQVEVLTKEVEALENALDSSEEECRRMLIQRRAQTAEAANAAMEKSGLTFHQCDMVAYYDSLTGSSKARPNSGDDPAGETRRQIVLPCDESELRYITRYSKEIHQAMEERRVPPEVQIFLLKQQLVDASIYNRSLQAVISSLEWKLRTEQAKAKQRESYCSVLEKCNEELDKVLNETYASYCKLRKKIEKFRSEQYERSDRMCATFLSVGVDSASVVATTVGKASLNPTVLITGQNPAGVKMVKTFNRISLLGPPEGEELRPSRNMSVVKIVDDRGAKALEERVAELQTELNLQVARAEQLKRCYLSSKATIVSLKGMAREAERSSQNALKREAANWLTITTKLKARSSRV